MQQKLIYPFALGVVMLLSFCAPARSPQTGAEPAFAVKEVNFSTESASTVAPEDIILEVGFFLGLMDTPSYCEPQPHPGICYAPEEVEWLDNFSIVTSGWSYDEKIRISIIAPDGRQTTALGSARDEEAVISYGDVGQYNHYIYGYKNHYLYNYVFVPDLGMPPGEYEFVFEGKSGRVRETVNIDMSASPRMRSFDKNKIVLSGFLPDEHIFLYAYEPNQDNAKQEILMGVAEYDMDKNGALVINTGNDTLSFCVVGESSGLVDPDGILYCLKK
jgi:hypothetical protein